VTAPLASPRALWSATTAADRLVSIGLIVLSVVLAAALRFSSSAPDRAIVTVDGAEVARLALAESGRTVVEGRLGPVLIEVADGGVRVAESGCPQRLCVAMGTKRHAGEVLACVPNAVVVRLEGGREDPSVPDAVTR
jgi:hypothetical protein